ncbi:MAG TPA: hypothetical protein VGP33_09250 [Chloroflexota bacterium]|nr:hypothetical protein [Chloroflexota bacterium]
MERRQQPPVATRGRLNLAELVDQGLVELTELRLADAAALLAVELEILEQLAATERQIQGAGAARQQLLGYVAAPGVGDLHDYVERRLVTEYLLATGVDAVVTPLVKGAPLYSHIARDATLVAIPGDIAPEAIIYRLTSCPRLLLYGLDGDGIELRGRLFRRVIEPTAANWPEAAQLRAEGRTAGEPADLCTLLASLQRGQLPHPPSPEPAAAQVQPTVAERRRARRLRLNGID